MCEARGHRRWPEFSSTGTDDGSEDAHVYTIGELARNFGITLRALRFYESQGLINPDRQGRRRLYGRKDADRVAAILRAKKCGFHLSEIRRMIMDESPQQKLNLSRERCLEQIHLFERKLAEIADALAELRRIYASGALDGMPVAAE